MQTNTLEYNKETTKITLNTYDDGFLLSEIDISEVVLTRCQPWRANAKAGSPR
jgi:hypothetical protein